MKNSLDQTKNCDRCSLAHYFAFVVLPLPSSTTDFDIDLLKKGREEKADPRI